MWVIPNGRKEHTNVTLFAYITIFWNPSVSAQEKEVVLLRGVNFVSRKALDG